MWVSRGVALGAEWDDAKLEDYHPVPDGSFFTMIEERSGINNEYQLLLKTPQWDEEFSKYMENVVFKPSASGKSLVHDGELNFTNDEEYYLRKWEIEKIAVDVGLKSKKMEVMVDRLTWVKVEKNTENVVATLKSSWIWRHGDDN